LPLIFIYRILSKLFALHKFRKSKAFYVILLFITMWLVSSTLFYYSEHIVAARSDVDFYTALYWSIITMATIGYGDITPVRGLGWVVAGFTALLGIISYTLIISVLAEWFLTNSMKKLMGMSPFRNKKVIVIGDSESCSEIVDELVLNNLGEETGWFTPEKPRVDPRVEYTVGDPRDEELLKKIGVEKAEHIILCFRDDSVALHTLLLLRKYNKRARYSALVNQSINEDLFREAGAEQVLSTKMIGRAMASAVFEPSVLNVLTDIITARGEGDLIEYTVSSRDSGKRTKRSRIL